MKTYDCQICGHLVLLEPREVEEIGAYCLEHLFSEQLPALNQQADDAAVREKQPGDLRQDTNRTAPTNHQQEEVAMTHSTPEPAEFGTYMPNCPELDDMEHQCDSTRPAHRLRVTTEACELKADISLNEVFQHGKQVHAIRLEIIDEMNHFAELTLYPEQFQHIAKWLSERAAEMFSDEG